MDTVVIFNKMVKLLENDQNRMVHFLLCFRCIEAKNEFDIFVI